MDGYAKRTVEQKAAAFQTSKQGRSRYLPLHQSEGHVAQARNVLVQMQAAEEATNRMLRDAARCQRLFDWAGRAEVIW